MFGVTDCIEYIKTDSGCCIERLGGKYIVRIVEYKPRHPSDANYNETDAIQVFAQKICVDYVFKCDSEAYIYYADIRKRVKLPFDAEHDKYDAMLKKYLGEMRKILAEGIIPERQKKQNCSGCSLESCCFPTSKRLTVKEEIKRINESSE